MFVEPSFYFAQEAVPFFAGLFNKAKDKSIVRKLRGVMRLINLICTQVGS
jgi:hypothetical protein